MSTQILVSCIALVMSVIALACSLLLSYRQEKDAEERYQERLREINVLENRKK